eukprot:CAMPEP_0175080892 /NCGR_PEP_ID=MMETSP0052_2-20121109/25797_1 /TAXON_ID=51329 ORGANISM="Polytomella parva, Strain SAG 63-3" /NCGR_SAMPLE_ID=MMETSP0052_2 /ASSEMBLY_ACC=CAM_ASM_000194 /LENGTH=564 /DNA_ID=CAMNT_0016351717 /DNA_START=59 /DNA_END=1749 /DNA_ORIENTATION=-
MPQTRILFFLSLLLCTFSHSNAAKCYGHHKKADYPECIQLDPYFAVAWTYTNDTITFAIEADGWLNYFGVGFSEVGPLGVDMGIVYAGTQAQQWLIGDYFTSSFSSVTPTLDYTQNWTIVNAPEQVSANYTSAVITRALDTCDLEDVSIVPGIERSFFWVYGYSGWDDAKLHWPSYGSYGNLSNLILVPSLTYTDSAIYSLNTYVPSSTTPASSSHANVTTSTPTLTPTYQTATFALPANTTINQDNYSALCMNVQLPSGGPYHIVSFQGYLNSSHAHYITAMACDQNVVPTGTPAPAVSLSPSLSPAAAAAAAAASAAASAAGAKVYECLGAVPPSCEKLMLVWGAGAATFTAPSAAGFLFGSGSDKRGNTGPKYLVLQIRYDPSPLAGSTSLAAVDSGTGFTLNYTSTLRDYSMGVLALGTMDINLPPGQTRVSTTPNICPESCTALRVLSATSDGTSTSDSDGDDAAAVNGMITSSNSSSNSSGGNSSSSSGGNSSSSGGNSNNSSSSSNNTSNTITISSSSPPLSSSSSSSSSSSGRRSLRNASVVPITPFSSSSSSPSP